MIGCTVSTLGGLKQGIERAAALEYQCTQVYITKSRSWDIGLINFDNLEEYSKSFHIRLIGHIPLIVNIASKKMPYGKNLFIDLSRRFCVQINVESES